MTRVAVIGGGQNVEHQVSLASAASVRAALAPSCEVTELTIGRDGMWCAEDGAPLGLTTARSLVAAVALVSACDVVFPMVHGPLGEDGALAALCELAGVPYVGSPPGAGAVGMDKWATKLVAEAVGVLTAPAVLVTKESTVDFTGPVVVKPVSAGSSFGVRLVEAAEDLVPAVRAALELDDRVLVEDVVVGREIDIAVLDDPDSGLCTAPPLEIIAPGALFDTETKYSGSAQFVVPASVTDAELKALSDAALLVYRTLGCRGVARVDFFLTSAGPVLNEINTTPGMTAESQVPRMFAAAGTSYPDLVDRLVRSALSSSTYRTSTPRF